ncbi:hypothetical protein GCM10010464_30970 [Pseudonocardia yunnanensis]
MSRRRQQRILCTVRYVETFLGEDPLDVPWSGWVTWPSSGGSGARRVKRYAERRQTMCDHA